MNVGTLALNDKLISATDNKKIKTADFITSPERHSHATIIVGIVKNKNRDKIYLIGPSYISAQSIDIITNLSIGNLISAINCISIRNLY